MRASPRSRWLARPVTMAVSLLLGMPASVIGAVVEPTSIIANEVVMTTGGTRVEVDGKGIRGTLSVRGYDEGVAVTEELSVDQYLGGIAEVPFSWDDDALAAQAVAARTYLARTLADGRSQSGSAFDYDICATTACQVYAGVDLIEGPEGDRWRRAVSSTTDEILLDVNGRPAQAFYSSTSGGRTRSVEDIFTGADPVSYLEAVESPGEDSPFAEWDYTITAHEMERLAREADLIEGDLLDVETTTTDDGAGPWTVFFEGSDSSSTVPTWVLRTKLNRAAEAVMADRLPVQRPDVDRRYPQTIMSPSFTIVPVDVVLPSVLGPAKPERLYRILGNGWGHLVGMSQYGALAMAESGVSYPDILAHFYGGLRPQRAGSALPELLTVALATERREVSLVPDGPVTVTVDGDVLAEGAVGGWRFEAAGSRLRVIPPIGLGLPPEISEVVVLGRWLIADLATAGEVHVSSGVGDNRVVTRDWVLVEAGQLWALLPAEPEIVTVMIRSPEGFDRVQLRVDGSLE